MNKPQIELAIAHAYARGKKRLELRMNVARAQKRLAARKRGQLVLVHSAPQEEK